MGIHEVSLLAVARWRIYGGDPAEYALQSFPGWAFINPLVYPQVSERLWGGMARYRLDGLVENSVLIQTNMLLFSGPDTADSPIMVPFMRTFVPLLLAHLRYLSKQTSLTHAHVGGTQSRPESPAIPVPVLPPARPGQSMWMLNYFLNTAITWAHVEQADAGAVTGAPALFASVLLDALDAYADQDNRGTILYAAMAVEIIARAKLSGGRSGRPYMQSLLHDLPLQLLGRSLRDDNPILFELAESLYRTRNDLVHQGNSPPRPEALPLDGPGAYHALECADAVFHWFGEPGGYMPSHGAVVADEPVGHVLDLTVAGYIPISYQSALSQPPQPRNP